MSGPRTEFELYIFWETEKALLVGRQLEDRDTNAAFWLYPRSQVEIVSSHYVMGAKIGVLSIPNWLAKKFNLDASLDGVELQEPLHPDDDADDDYDVIE